MWYYINCKLWPSFLLSTLLFHLFPRFTRPYITFFALLGRKATFTHSLTEYEEVVLEGKQTYGIQNFSTHISIKLYINILLILIIILLVNNSIRINENMDHMLFFITIHHPICLPSLTGSVFLWYNLVIFTTVTPERHRKNSGACSSGMKIRCLAHVNRTVFHVIRVCIIWNVRVEIDGWYLRCNTHRLGMATGHILPGYGQPVTNLKRSKSAYPLDKTRIREYAYMNVPAPRYDELSHIRDSARSVWSANPTYATSYNNHYTGRGLDEPTRSRPTSPTRLHKPHPPLWDQCYILSFFYECIHLAIKIRIDDVSQIIYLMHTINCYSYM